MSRTLRFYATFVLVVALAGCTWDESRPPDASLDAVDGLGDNEDPGGDPGPPPVHQGFDVVDPHGAVRISYLDDATGGFDFDGRYVVYSSWELYLYLVDLETQREVRLYPVSPVQNGSRGARTWPRVANGIVACAGHDGIVPPRILYLYYIEEERWYIPNLPDAKPSYFDFDSSRIVFNDERHWNEDGGKNIEVYLYDIEDGVELRLTDQYRQQFVPEIEGQYIVWEDYSKGQFKEEVVLYNLETGQSRNLTNDDTRQFGLSIHDDLVAWTDLRHGQVNPNGTYTNADIYLYRISTGETRRITDEEHDQEFPCVHGRWVAWSDLRHGSRNESFQPSGVRVYVHDLVTGQQKAVTFGEEMIEGTPKIWGNTLVYRSCCIDDGGALWMVDLGRYFDLEAD